MASTRMLLRMISLVWTSTPARFSASRSRRLRMTSTRSLGRMNPPAPVSGEISVEIARMPDGRIAAMKPEPPALMSFASRTGSPARDGAGHLLDGLRHLGAAHEVRAGGGGRPDLPLDIACGQDLTHADIDLGDQNLDGVDLCDGSRRSGRRVGSCRQQCGNSASSNGNAEDNETRGFHTLHFPRSRSGRFGPSLVISPAKRQSMVNEAYLNPVNRNLPRRPC